MELDTYVFDQLAQSRFPTNNAFRTPNYVVAVREQPSMVSRRVGDDIKDVPDILSRRERRPLEGKAQTACGSRNLGIYFANTLALENGQNDGIEIKIIL